jgi:hypothetical protein
MPLKIIFMILFFIGIALLFLVKRDSYKKEFLYYYVLIGIFIIFNWLITIPLTGEHTGNFHHISFLSPFIIAVAVGFALKIFETKMLSKYKQSTISTISGIFIIIIIAFAFYNINIFSNEFSNDRFRSQGFGPMNPIYSSLQNFVFSNNLPVEKSIVISTNELCFAVNAFTSMRCLAGRWPHMLTWEDFQKNWLDEAIILYGNNTNTKLGIIMDYERKYNVTMYLYWDYFWAQSEYTFDENGNLVNTFDPLRFMNKSIATDLIQNNISFFLNKQPLDPAFGQDYLQRDLTILSPSNYYNATHPWKPNLDKYLQEVWSYDYQGQKIAILYKINVE